MCLPESATVSAALVVALKRGTMTADPGLLCLGWVGAAAAVALELVIAAGTTSAVLDDGGHEDDVVVVAKVKAECGILTGSMIDANDRFGYVLCKNKYKTINFNYTV